MKIVREPTGERLIGSVVAIGFFDGVHIGHQALLGSVRERAHAEGLSAVVVTFDRHPAHVLRPAVAPRLLSTLDQRLEHIAECGIDATWVVQFDEAKAREPAEQFVRSTLQVGVDARVVVVGEDFHFGNQRLGNLALLQAWGLREHREVIGLELVSLSGERARPEWQVSSTAIRRALAEGRLSDANAMLGRSHELRGPVVRGDQRGRTLGFPTANVAVDPTICLPASGVFAGRLRCRGQWHDAAIYVGNRPTFYRGAEHVVVEVHVLGFVGDLYGLDVDVQFIHLVRPEQRFEGPDALVEQLRLDCQEALVLLSN